MTLKIRLTKGNGDLEDLYLNDNADNIYPQIKECSIHDAHPKDTLTNVIPKCSLINTLDISSTSIFRLEDHF